MATLKTFEDIMAWQKARELNKKVGEYIDTGCFKRNFRLIDQIEGLPDLLWIILQKASNVVPIKSFYNSYTFQKVLVVN